MTTSKPFRAFSIYKAALASLVLGMCLAAPLSPCEYRYWWPEEYDTLSFIEPSIVPEKEMRKYWNFFSEPYEVVPENKTWSRYESLMLSTGEWGSASDILDEWKSYLTSRGWKGADVSRNTLWKFLLGGVPVSYHLGMEDRGNKEARDCQRYLKELLLQRNFRKPGNPFASFAVFKDVMEYVDFNNRLYPLVDPMTSVVRIYDWKAGRSITVQSDPKELEVMYQSAIHKSSDPSLDSYMRLKYAYQAIRIKAAMKDYNGLLALYDRLVGASEIDSLTRTRCMGYRALALLNTGEREKSFRQYVEVSDKNSEMYLIARQSLHRVFQAKEVMGYIARLPNDGQKCSATLLWALSQERDWALQNLENMIRFGVQMPETEALLVRMVQLAERDNMLNDRIRLIGENLKHPQADLLERLHAIERRFLGEQNREYWPESTEKASATLIDYSRWIDLCDKTSMNPRVRQPALWEAVGGYLALLQGRNARAVSLLKRARMRKTENVVLEHQIHLWSTLADLQAEKRAVGKDVQKEFLKTIEWARTLDKSWNNAGLYHSLWVLAGQKFLFLKDIPRSTLCFNKAGGQYGFSGPAHYHLEYNQSYQTANYLLDAIATDIELEELQKILSGQETGVFDKAICVGSINGDDVLLNLSIRCMRRGDYHTAENYLSRMDPKYFGEGAIDRDTGVLYYAGSRIIKRKLFLFGMNGYDGNTKDARKPLGLREYCKLLMNLTDRVAEARKAGKKDLALLLFQLGEAKSVGLNGWPEILRAYCTKTTHTYYPETNESFPLGIPSMKREMDKRYVAFEKSVPDNGISTREAFHEVANLKTDPELRARSLAILASGVWGKESEAYLVRLKHELASTKFYKDFSSWCASIQNLVIQEP